MEEEEEVEEEGQQEMEEEVRGQVEERGAGEQVLVTDRATGMGVGSRVLTRMSSYKHVLVANVGIIRAHLVVRQVSSSCQTDFAVMSLLYAHSQP